MKTVLIAAMPRHGVLQTFNLNPFTFKRINLLTFWITLATGSIGAQTTTLFSSSSLTEGQLTTEQYAVKQSYQTRSNVSNVQIINLLPTSQIQQSTILNIQVPGDTTTYTFVASTREAYSNGNFYWFGNLIKISGYQGIEPPSDFYTGLLSITGNNGQVFGELRIDTTYFKIPYLGDGLNAIVSYDFSDDVKPTCGSEGSGQSIPDTVADDRALCPVVDILILYTQEVLDTFPDVENIGLQAFQNARQALLNSKVYPDEVDLHLTGVALLPGFTATGTYLDDTIPITTKNSPARQLRDAYHADLVFILVPDIYSEFYGAIFAFGDSPSDGEKAFAFVEVEAANSPRYTFAHELGHLFGGRHQHMNNCALGADDSGLQDAHASDWNKGFHFLLIDRRKYYQTLLSSCDYSYITKILNYSNPDVSYNGHATGVLSWRNNAKIIQDAVCRISNYVTSHDLNAYTDGPNNYVCPGYSFGFRGFAVGDYGPYEFHWKYKLGPSGSWIDYTPTGSPDNFNFTVPANFFGTIYVELTVTNGTDVATVSTYAYSDYLNCPHRSAHQRTDQVFEKSTDLSVIPNPASEVIEVKFGKKIIGTIEVFVSNNLGNISFSRAIDLSDVGTDRIILNLPELPNGMYILNVKQLGAPPKVQRFLITR